MADASLAAQLFREATTKAKLSGNFAPSAQNAQTKLEPPMETVYHAGKAQFLPPTYAMNSRPRRCRAGSGAPSYSTRRPPDAISRPSIPPPVVGGLAPQPVPLPENYIQAREEGSLPVRMAGPGSGGVPAVVWKTPPENVPVHTLLPLLIAGMRDETDVGRFVATQGACELMDVAARLGTLLPCLPGVVEPLRTALFTRQPHIICSALRFLMRLLKSDDNVGLALRPFYGKLLTPIAPLLLRRASFPSGDELDRAADRAINPDDLAAAVLPILEMHGGPDAGVEIRRTIPSYRPIVEPLHRGFVAPTFRNGDRILVSGKIVELIGRTDHRGSAITAALTRGRGTGTC